MRHTDDRLSSVPVEEAFTEAAEEVGEGFRIRARARGSRGGHFILRNGIFPNVPDANGDSALRALPLQFLVDDLDSLDARVLELLPHALGALLGAFLGVFWEGAREQDSVDWCAAEGRLHDFVDPDGIIGGSGL